MDTFTQFGDTMAISNAQFTAIDSYTLIKTGDGTDTIPTAFPITTLTGDINLLTPTYGASGPDTKANYLEMLFTLNAAGTGTIEITGASEGGPEEYICSLALSSAAGIVESGIWKWSDTITLTSYHLSGCGIAIADSGNSRVGKLALDAIGYRFFKLYSTALGTATSVRCYARYF